MELKDIIRSDSDRLFILDPECFVIFTGENLDDERPFIRIGNWMDLPVELIPLVENIIVTDGISGNPSLEQFNIDITQLRENRYIGSENIVTRYLEFQKIFGLDLTNATIVNVEKDIPELSQEKSISGKNQFMGVFYRNGNFKTVHSDNEIINLYDIESGSPRTTELLDRQRDCSRGSGRYRGAGLVILSRNPVFYSRDTFFTYLMPSVSSDEMRSLCINPVNIKYLFFPSSNYINVPPFLKWIHGREGRLSVFSDRPEDWERIRKIFPKAGITVLPFCDMKVQQDEKTCFETIKKSFNLKITLTDPAGEKLTLAFLKGSGQAREILKEQFDGILVSYSVFEDITLLFKSTDTPVAIMDDGNPRLSRVPSQDHVILYQGIQYEFTRTWDESLLSGLLLPEGIDPDRIAAKDLSSIVQVLSGETADRDLQIRLFNLLSLARLFLFGTTDRAYAAELKKTCRELADRVNSSIMQLAGSEYRVLLVFTNKTIIQFFQSNHTEDPGIDFPVFTAFRNRITEDRERLRLLLQLLTGRDVHRTSLSHVDELTAAIHERKKLYRNSDIPGYYNQESSNDSYPEIDEQDDSEPDSISGIERLKKTILSPQNRKYLIGIPFICAVLILAAIVMLTRPVKNTDVSNPRKDVSAAVEDRRIIDKFSITVTDTDIYEYANQVALKNGYSPISMSELKKMNPNWIYPSNVFILLDGEKIVVQKGDTLWDLAHAKLMRLNIEFFRVIERLEKSPASQWQSIVEEAERYAFTGRNRRILEEKKRNLFNDGKR